MTKAIIFDCFGVLVNESWLAFKDRYFSHDPELFQKAGELNRLTDIGQLTYEEYLRQVAELANMPEEDVTRLIENNPPNLLLLRYIKDYLKPAYKIGMLSNAAGDWLEELFKPDEGALFDATALSFELDFGKPDPRAYQEIAKRLNVVPEECIFVDDLERYCAAANEVGMQAIWYKDFEQMKAELEGLLASSNH